MPFNNKYIIAERRAKISKMYLSGMAQFEISNETDISQQQISSDLKVLRKEWINSALIDFNEARSKELAKIDNLEIEYWDAWKKSKEDYEKSKRKYQDKQLKELNKEDVIMTGDPRFLEGVRWCITKRCEIFGFNAVNKYDFTTKGDKLSLTSIDTETLLKIANNTTEASKK